MHNDPSWRWEQYWLSDQFGRIPSGCYANLECAKPAATEKANILRRPITIEYKDKEWLIHPSKEKS